MQAIEQQVTDIIQETLEGLGFGVVQVTLKGSAHKVLEILIDRLDGSTICVADCRNVSHHVSALLDVEDIINVKYFLEVSSAGIERPLVKFQDYIKFLGREVTIKLKNLLNGQTRYQGKIFKAENNQIYLNTSAGEVIILFEHIKKASLVLTEEMFRNLINKKS